MCKNYTFYCHPFYQPVKSNAWSKFLKAFVSFFKGEKAIVLSSPGERKQMLPTFPTLLGTSCPGPYVASAYHASFLVCMLTAQSLSVSLSSTYIVISVGSSYSVLKSLLSSPFMALSLEYSRMVLMFQLWLNNIGSYVHSPVWLVCGVGIHSQSDRRFLLLRVACKGWWWCC